MGLGNVLKLQKPGHSEHNLEPFPTRSVSAMCFRVSVFLSVCVHASCINVSDIGWSVGGDAFILTGMRNLKEHYPFKCFLKTRAESLCGGFLGRRRRREPRETRLTRYIWSGSWSDCIFYTHTHTHTNNIIFAYASGWGVYKRSVRFGQKGQGCLVGVVLCPVKVLPFYGAIFIGE